MLYMVLLIFFLIQFLVVLGALLLAIFLTRPEVPLSGDGSLERTAKEQKHRGKRLGTGAILTLGF